jgi:putative isomerase
VLAPDEWGTWDARHHTAVVHPGSGLRLRGAIGCGSQVADGFTWRRGLVDVGHRSVDGRYAAITVGCGHATLALEYARTGEGHLLGSMVLETEAADHELVVILDRGEVSDDLTARIGDADWRLALSEPGEVTRDEDATIVRIPADRVTLTCAPVGATVEASLTGIAKSATDAALRSGGWLGDAAAGYARVLTWNTVYAPDLGRVIVPCSRDFVCEQRGGFYGTWALHAWDTLFAGLTAAWLDPGYARLIFGQILEQATPAGFLPNRVSDERGRTDDRSQPPVGALTVLKAYLSSGLSDATRDRRLIDDETYRTLTRWHHWWPRARRGPAGLLAWGSDPTADPTSASVDNCRRESGLDDSPMYDDVGYDPATHTMDLADVGLGSLHVADAEALAGIARRRGDHAAAEALLGQATVARARIDAQLWDERRGHYANRRADGGFQVHIAPTYLYPLLAGVPSPERAERLVAALLTPELLGGSPPLPSVARSDPGYTGHYCRGRLWGPPAYLVYEGLRRYGFGGWCDTIATDLLDLFRAEWETHRHVHENYPLEPHEDIHPFAERSDFLHTFGNLLAYIAMLQIADPRPDGWRFAHPGHDATLAGIPLGEGVLDLRAAGDRLVVSLDGAPLLDLSRSVTVTGYERTATTVRGTATGPGDLWVADPTGTPVRLAVSTGAPLEFHFGEESP